MKNLQHTTVTSKYAFIVLAVTALLCDTSNSVALAQTAYNMEDMGSRVTATIIYDSKNPKLVTGIFRNTVSDGIVEVSSGGWVGPIGAGIFQGSEEVPLPHISYRFAVRDASGVLRLLDLEGHGKNNWHESQIVEDRAVLRSDGSDAKFGLSSVLDGGVESISVGPIDNAIEIVSQGRFANGYLNIDTIGGVELLFPANLTATDGHIVLSNSQEKLLLASLNKKSEGNTEVEE